MVVGDRHRSSGDYNIRGWNKYNIITEIYISSLSWGEKKLSISQAKTLPPTHGRNLVGDGPPPPTFSAFRLILWLQQPLIWVNYCQPFPPPHIAKGNCVTQARSHGGGGRGGLSPPWKNLSPPRLPALTFYRYMYWGLFPPWNSVSPPPLLTIPGYGAGVTAPTPTPRYLMAI